MTGFKHKSPREFFLKILFLCSIEKTINIEVINIGYLTTATGQVSKKATTSFSYGKSISGAITYAINQINNDGNILPNHRLEMEFYDTRGSPNNGTLGLSLLWKKGVVAFFGPLDTCVIEGRMASSWNLPIFSYKCESSEVSDKGLYPTLVRTIPTESRILKSIISLLLHFNWHKFSIVRLVNRKWQALAEKLITACKSFNISLNHEKLFSRPTFGRLTKQNPFPKIVEETYIDTRVYIFLGNELSMIDFLNSLSERGLVQSGKYVVVYPPKDPYDPKFSPSKYTKSFDELTKHNITVNWMRSRCLLVIVPSLPVTNYSNFEKAVEKYNKLPPFNFKLGKLNFKLQIPVYAATLYDAVMLYSKALDEHLRRNGSVTDGTKIVARILNRNYKSIQGFLVNIDANGDAEGNFTLLGIDENHTMGSVGNFLHEKHQNIPRFIERKDRPIWWINGPPLDEPKCGYRSEKCLDKNDEYVKEIAGGVVSSLIFLIAVFGFLAFKYYRYEQEVAGLSWKINVEELFSPENAALSKRSGSLHSSSLTMESSRSSVTGGSIAQKFTLTSKYKGQVVALKVFERKHIDLNRDIKKQMKIMRDLRHDNVNAFLGACVDVSEFIVVTEYCARGSLQDILVNDDLTLDDMIVSSLVKDLMHGLTFLQQSHLGCHGNLKSSNCIVNSRWTLQLTDFGLREIRMTAYTPENEYPYYRNLLWTAPELLRTGSKLGSKSGDVYAFGIILQEIFGRQGPFCTWQSDVTIKDIVYKVKEGASSSTILRPAVDFIPIDQYLKDVMVSCWAEDPLTRPTLRQISVTLKPLRRGMKSNIFDNMLAIMEKYQTNLEALVDERTMQLNEEKRKTENLLYRMLPKSVAEDLKKGQTIQPEAFECVTIYFSDICGFTALSAESTPLQVVDLLNDLYTMFDTTISHYDVYKVETIGDAYMVVSGCPIRNDNHAGEIASMSLDLLRSIKTFRIRHRPDKSINLRIGLHSGPCVAGVVGLTMPRYCLFGDTVNTASRMESNGEPLKIHCSSWCRDLLLKLGGYNLEIRGNIEMKGKGSLTTYWLISENENIRNDRMMRQTSKNNLIDNVHWEKFLSKPKDKCKLTSKNHTTKNSTNSKLTSDGLSSKLINDTLKESEEAIFINDTRYSVDLDDSDSGALQVHEKLLLGERPESDSCSEECFMLQHFKTPKR